MRQMPIFAAVTLLGLTASVMLIKPLNALLLGERYAENLGINVVRVRNWLLVVTGLLSAITGSLLRTDSVYRFSCSSYS